ncbi:unnamed protein product [Paramecium sonneborni]|uniref:Uncharacterized protein n=1 Tax=Paramecium sonneborni TaxID=65129 RepID=A0A8S1Q7Z7_9CILI|nr:unnamed protein product [Paramecium sonneborni]
MEEEETQIMQLRDSDSEDDLIPQFKIMSLRDGIHKKVQLLTNHINSLLYDLRKQYLEKVEKEKNQIVEE